MRRRIVTALGLLSLGLSCGMKPSLAADKPVGSARLKAIRELSARIDQRIDARLQAESVEPSPTADDAEFFRRVWLHLAGTIPPVSEVRRFLAQTEPDKREQAIDGLLSRPSFVRQFTLFWRQAWLPEADTDPQVQARGSQLEFWLRQQLVNDRRYDDIVRDIIAVPVSNKSTVGAPQNESGPMAFLLAKDAKPDNLAAGASRAFLGVRLDCAQCHDHPFDRWKRDQFWSFAAFFAGLERDDENQPMRNGLLKEVTDRRELMVPETERLVGAAFLDGSEPKWRSRGGRQVLADWITSPANPWFAKAAVNRLWGHLFGLGLVDPVDDFSSANAPSHPELLDELASAFVAQDYDVKFILRAIMGTQAYQRTSRQLHPEVSPQLLAAMPIQGLTAEQLVRSVSLIVGPDAPVVDMRGPIGAQPDELSATFARPGELPTQRQTTILQALTLMNGRTVATASDLQTGSLLAAVTDFPALTVSERIETLFLGTLGRPPTAAESTRLTRYAESAADPKSACSDILWALLNSVEFGCNH